MIDDLFALLADEPRRRVLVSLLDVESGVVTLEEAALTRGAAARAGGSAPVGLAGEKSVDDVSPAEVALRHVHLPKLAEADLIDWDREAGTVSRGPRFAQAEPLLRLLVRNQHELPGRLV